MQANSDALAPRVREIRLEMFGEDGISSVSQSMHIPAQTWENFENGVAIPAWIILQFIEITGVEAHWLLTGEGERYRDRSTELPKSASG